MLSSEFSAEMGALIRSLEAQVRLHPELLNADPKDVIEALDRLLVTIISARIALKRAATQEQK